MKRGGRLRARPRHRDRPARYGVPFFTAVRCVEELDPELLDPLEPDVELLDDPEDPEDSEDPEDPDELDELFAFGCELPLLLDPLPCLYPCPFTTLPWGRDPSASRVTITIGFDP